MENQEKKFARYTVTSALPYANGPVHIGHLAGVYIPADIYVRYLRSIGKDVVFIGGSDEHGVPITIKARKEGITPQEVVDRYHNIIKKSFEDLGVSFDVYSRTSSPIHHETATEFFKTLHDKGVFLEQVTEQLYDEEAQQFLADRYITGTCPHCGNDKAYGDQCEKCGTTLNATDLINPISTFSGNTPVKKETRHWFLPLDKDEQWLREWIVEGHKDDWKTNVYGQCKSWLDSGLHPRAVTRDLDWGVKVPVEGAENKVLYVWFDAPIGYISATREWSQQTGKDWKPYWKNEDSKLVHFIGKDNIVFHCIIFPSMLKAEGSYILPDNVPANEFLNLEGDKISTSRNWAVWLHEYLEEFPGQQDVLRYVLCSNAPETKDNEFTWKDFQAKNNNELVAILGNFVNRTMVLMQKFYESKVPAMGILNDNDIQTLQELTLFKDSIGKSIELYRFREALASVMNLARLGNKYLTDNEPWKAINTDPERVKTVMNICLQICANLSIATEPFMPFTATKMCKMLDIPQYKWDMIGKYDIVKEGQMVTTPELLFAKIEEEAIAFQLQKLENSRKQNLLEEAKATPQKAATSFDEFQKMDIRVATILEAEKVAKTKNLLKLLVDTGIDKRTIISGIADHYAPEDIIGQKVCMLVNLEPRTIKGIESNGMILMAQNADGGLSFIAPTKDIINGGEVK